MPPEQINQKAVLWNNFKCWGKAARLRCWKDEKFRSLNCSSYRQTPKRFKIKGNKIRPLQIACSWFASVSYSVRPHHLHEACFSLAASEPCTAVLVEHLYSAGLHLICCVFLVYKLKLGLTSSSWSRCCHARPRVMLKSSCVCHWDLYSVLLAQWHSSLPKVPQEQQPCKQATVFLVF